MRIAVVGAGIAGLTTAWLLEPEHDVTVFEARPRTGGHVHTHTFEHEGRTVSLDLGAQHVSPSDFPTHRALRRRLGIGPGAEIRFPLHLTVTRAGVPDPILVTPDTARDDRAGRIAVTGPGWAHLGAFMAAATAHDQADGDRATTVADIATEANVPAHARDDLLFPWLASFVGCHVDEAAGLSARAAAAWAVRTPAAAPDAAAEWDNLTDGLGAVTDALTRDLGSRTHRATPVLAVSRAETSVVVRTRDGEADFDELVLATPAPVAAGLLAGIDPSRAHALDHMPHVQVAVALHRDPHGMPVERAHWSSTNVHVHDGWGESTSWYGPALGVDLFKSWTTHRDPPKDVVHHEVFHQLLPTPGAHRARRTLLAAQGTRRVHLAGSHLGDLDSQESAVRSALDVAAHLAPTSPRVADLTGAGR